MSMGANSLLIVPAGFNPGDRLRQLYPPGLTHTAGTILTVPAGQGFGGVGSINDPVVCQGTIAAAAGRHQPQQRARCSPAPARVSLGNGSLTVNNPASGISGGSLSRTTNTSARRHRDVHPLRRDHSVSATSISATTRPTAEPTTSAGRAHCMPATNSRLLRHGNDSPRPAGPIRYRHRCYLGVQHRQQRRRTT